MLRTVIRSRRRSSLKKLLFKIAAALIALIIILCLLLFIPHKNNTFSAKELVKLDIAIDDQIVPFKDGAVYINNEQGKIFYFNSKNDQWGLDGAVKDMKIVSSDDKLAVYIATKLQMINKDGQLIYSKIYDYPIQKLALGNDICVILQYPEGTVSNLLILDNQGLIIDTLAEQTNERLIDFGTYGSNGVWVITVQTGGINPEYKFSTYKYDPKKRITVSHSESNQIVYKPVFSDGTISLVCSDELVAIDYTGKEVNRIRVSGYEYLSASLSTKTSDVLLAKLDAQGKRQAVLTELLCINSQGSAFKINTQDKIIDSAITKDYYYIFTRYKMLRYDKKNLKVLEYTLPQPMNSIISCSNYNILLKCDQAVYKLALS